MWSSDKKQMKEYANWLADYEPGSLERERLVEILKFCGKVLDYRAEQEKTIGALRSAGILLMQEHKALKEKYREAKEQLDLFDDDLK